MKRHLSSRPPLAKLLSVVIFIAILYCVYNLGGYLAHAKNQADANVVPSHPSWVETLRWDPALFLWHSFLSPLEVEQLRVPDNELTGDFLKRLGDKVDLWAQVQSNAPLQSVRSLSQDFHLDGREKPIATVWIFLVEGVEIQFPNSYSVTPKKVCQPIFFLNRILYVGTTTKVVQDRS
eukprot:TRINITY_DN5947_c0_g1_i4.p1 TRINITY_DN5947_c0_g1~~TRINITY_DN5947_c0_g1_i4.p1  ORF type:complete len:193 (+),score=28.27 TRINITY_DN5947_c0_g1_i4:48-581(+)